MAMPIADDTVVTIHYTLKDEAGEVIDSSEGSEPLAYMHGHGQIVAGLESALTGKAPGDHVDVVVPPEAGYGLRDPRGVQQVPRRDFSGIDVIEAGMQFHAEGPQGAAVVTVVAVEGDTVTIDANHPLAGASLNFSVDVVDVRPCTQEELSHGHAHGPGGHHHHD